MTVPADGEPASTAAERWADQLGSWGLPDEIVAQAPISPWSHDVRTFVADDTIDRSSTSARWAREVLPPAGGTVLDVGCGGGRAALALVPPATELIGVDSSGAMLDAFVEAAESAGVARRTVHGAWPEVAPATPVADVVVCHNVAYNVADIAPFLLALSAHARLAVVLEVPTRHPMSAWSAAWRHFWDLDRPDGPTGDDLVAVVAELGLDPEHATSPRSPVSRFAEDATSLVAGARRRLCLSEDRDAELAAWLAEHPPAWPDTALTIRWPGLAEAE
ncbi:MAG: methyltransferase domain-containing protein [Ilumatobacter sp.]|uniref:class I SAM-dependent methyltransferase n=1 Tax=Ilumatobacter sp. TaxID=1967498 RepID=UPI0026028FFE|nr:class I SAM-dependent methyltransferase [Ilumatobacter sp.]MDJ0770053.1 methyltransferase domain-containing protein [Ilumatobacter sp.]